MLRKHKPIGTNRPLSYPKSASSFLYYLALFFLALAFGYGVLFPHRFWIIPRLDFLFVYFACALTFILFYLDRKRLDLSRASLTFSIILTAILLLTLPVIFTGQFEKKLLGLIVPISGAIAIVTLKPNPKILIPTIFLSLACLITAFAQQVFGENFWIDQIYANTDYYKENIRSDPVHANIAFGFFMTESVAYPSLLLFCLASNKLVFSINPRERQAQCIYISILFISIFGLFLCASRAFWIAVAIVSVLFFALTQQKSKTNAVLVVTLFAVVYLCICWIVNRTCLLHPGSVFVRGAPDRFMLFGGQALEKCGAFFNVSRLGAASEPLMLETLITTKSISSRLAIYDDFFSIFKADRGDKAITEINLHGLTDYHSTFIQIFFDLGPISLFALSTAVIFLILSFFRIRSKTFFQRLAMHFFLVMLLYSLTKNLLLNTTLWWSFAFAWSAVFCGDANSESRYVNIATA